MDRAATRITRMSCAAASLLLALSLPAGAGAPPLQLLAFDTIGSETPGFTAPAYPVLLPVTALRLRFDVAPALLASDFRLLRAGSAPVGAEDCGDDTGDASPVPIDGVGASADGTEITIVLQTETGLDAGSYRLIVCDTVPGLGAAVVRDFEVRGYPKLANPGFAAGLEGWSVAAPFAPLPTFSATWVPEDSDGADGSGALRIHSSSNTYLSIDPQQCIEAPTAPGRLRFRYRVLEGSVRFNVSLKFGFTDTPDDCLGPHHTLTLLGNDYEFPSATWQTFEAELLPYFWAPRQMVSLELALHRGPDEGTTLLIDDVGYSIDPSESIFLSGFEPLSP